MKTVTREIETTIISTLRAKADGTTEVEHIVLNGEHLDVEKAKKVAFKNDTLFTGVTYDKNVYELSVDDFMKYGKIVERAEKQVAGKPQAEKKTEDKPQAEKKNK